jgi:hypothetical protein
MNSSISGLINQVKKLEQKANQYIKTIEELEVQSKIIAGKITQGNLNLIQSLKTIQIKIRLIRQKHFEKAYLCDKLNDKVKQLKADETFFTNEDIKGFETALNSEGKDLSVDKLNPLFSNLSFLRVIRTRLETFESYEKCALLQKQIERISIE